MPDAPIAPVDLNAGGSSPDQLVQGGDGNWYLVNKTTGVATLVQGVPAKPAAATAPKTVRDPNTGIIYTVNADGTLTAQTDPSQKPVTPKDTVPGTGTPGSGNPADPSGPRYQAPTPDLPVDVYGAQTARATQEETVRKNAADEADKAATRSRQDQIDYLKQLADQYNRDVANGDKTNAQAIALFDAQVSMLTAAQNEGDNAVKYAQAANANRVGPGFGQHFADALSGRGVNFTGADFTYPTPDYQAIARKGAAAALAHLSPYAASIAGTMAPPGGYAGPGGAYAGPVVTDAANSVASAPVSPQFTAPHPPFPGYGAYRPGG